MYGPYSTEVLKSIAPISWPEWVKAPIESRLIETRLFLDEWTLRVNTPDFIPNDPISIPKRFSLLQDIEIMGLWVAVLAWGQRPVILKNASKLIDWMGGEPYRFILNHKPDDLKPFASFVHRTFNGTDALYLIDFLKRFYSENQSLEILFSKGVPDYPNIGPGLEAFNQAYFKPDWAPERSRKHFPTPSKGSACKRLNMFLRWMVRKDGSGVDFGLWNNIRPAQLICPLDIHSQATAKSLGLINRDAHNWKAAIELTENLSLLNPDDPVKYDFALYGLGILARHGNL